MNKIQTLRTLLLPLAVVGVLSSGAVASPAMAAENPCKDIKTSIIPCESGGGSGVAGNPIWNLLLLAIRILTATVAVVAVGGMIYASILYMTAGDNSGQVEKAIKTIINVVIGIALFAGLFALSEWLIPGGIFS